MLQLIDEHPESHLAPPVGSPERAHYYQWSVFAGPGLDPAIRMVFDNAIRADALQPALSGRDYLLGAGFSGADILVEHSCFMATVTGLIGGFPKLHSRRSDRLEATRYVDALEAFSELTCEAAGESSGVAS